MSFNSFPKDPLILNSLLTFTAHFRLITKVSNFHNILLTCPLANNLIRRFTYYSLVLSLVMYRENRQIHYPAKKAQCRSRDQCYETTVKISTSYMRHRLGALWLTTMHSQPIITLRRTTSNINLSFTEFETKKIID